MKAQRAPSRKVRHKAVFPVVGIGASAGGLEAFTDLLKALAPDTGMAFVLVQHMDPTHESLLYQLLSKATPMPVTQVTDRMHLEPNRVYVIPPNKNLTIEGGLLRLANLRGGHMPIDNFFSSLAQYRQKKAIGVILSGTASDGTLGLKAIKNSGGITFAQDQQSAKYTGMPLSAVASGNVDFVLPPEQIAHELQRQARNPGLPSSEAVSGLHEKSKAFQTILRLLRTATNVDFSLYKLPTIKRRIRRQMSLRATPELEQYAQYLEAHPSEINDLFDDILIPVTGFFREPGTFQALQKHVFPKIAASGGKEKSIRIWVAGCSTGEEAYSIAIALLEYMGDRTAPAKIQIFGTDLSERGIQVARNGMYAESALEGVSKDRLRRFFLKTEGGYQIAKSIREICIFARHDLAYDPPFAKLDLISCQNVFIYLQAALQKRILAGFHYALKPSGFLVLGKSETPTAYADFFRLEDRKNKIFSRKPLTVRSLPVPNLSIDRIRPATPALEEVSTSNLIEEARRILLDNYSAPAFVVDSDLNILHFQGDTSPFIKPSTGAASFHLLRMLRPEFAVDLRALIHQATKRSMPARKEGIEFRNGGESRLVSMEVVPFHAAASKAWNFMVLFPKTEPLPQQNSNDDSGSGKSRSDLREVAALRRELAATRTSLKSITEDQDVVNEELKTANEEIISSNEELQITNEELETAKEELQSANEELTTLNDELQSRNVELSTFADDLSNLLTGANIPILILNDRRRIQRFTPAAQRVFNLTPTDIGRPFDAISTNLEPANWHELISKVTDHLQTVERDIADRNGRWYSLRMRPYKSSENKVDGILVALIDVDQLKRQLGKSEESLKTSQELYQLMTENTQDIVTLLDAAGKYVYASPSREKLLGYTLQETIGKMPTDFCHPEDCKSVAMAFRKAARSGVPTQITKRVLAKDGRELWLEALISPIVDARGKVTQVIAASRDVTERQRINDNLRESEFLTRTLLETASQGIIVVNAKGQVVLSNRAAEKIFGYGKAELQGTNYIKLIPPPARSRHRNEHRNFFLKPRNRPIGVGLNLLGIRKTGETFPVEVSLSHLPMKQGPLAVAFVTDVSERKQAEVALRQNHDELLVLTAKLMSVQDEESRRISRELHDAFSQELAALATESRMLKRGLPPAAEVAAKKMESVALRIGKLATGIHQMSRRLHPAILDDLGLPAALRAECNALWELHGIHADFSSSHVRRPIPENASLCLYRIAQESLQNVAKHSGAHKVRMHLGIQGGEIRLAIEDFGQGFDLQAQKKKKRGLGMISMEERMRLVGGTLTIESKPGRGTRVLARVPLIKDKQ